MKILEKSIIKSIVLSTLVVVFIIAGLQAFVLFVSQLKEIGVGNYDFFATSKYVLFMLINRTYQFFPSCALVGCLCGLGSLASHNELIVMQVSGMSVRHIAWSVFCAAVIMVFCAFIISEGFGFRLTHIAEVQKEIAKNGGQTLDSKNGMWIQTGNRFIHVGKIVQGMYAEHVTQYAFNKDLKLNSIEFADKGIYKNNKWYLKNAKRTLFDDKKIRSETIALMPWIVDVNPKMANIIHADFDEIDLLNLYQLIQYKKANGLNPTSSILVFWQRIFQPIGTFVMVFLGVPFVFGPLRAVTIGFRISLGVFIGFSFFLINQFFGPFSLVYQISPLLGAVLPSVIFLIPTVWMFSRTR